MEGVESAAEVVSPLKLLLEVQDRDIELDRIAYRRRELPERKQLVALESAAADIGRRIAGVEAERAVLAGRQAEIDTHVRALEERIAQIDERLQASGSYRDQQAMGLERDSLDAQRVSAEDDELEVMELLEPLERELAELAVQLEALAAERRATTEALRVADGDLERDAAAVTATRDEVAAALPADLAATYERLRSKLGGVGAAKLVGGACSGCHLVLPSRERDQILHAPAGTVFYCEQCGRILVP